MSREPGEGPGAASYRDRYVAALVAGRRGEAAAVALGAVRDGMPVEAVYVDVLQEALYEIGRLWETNRISVAAEHLATAITQGVVARLYSFLPRPGTLRGRVVLAGVEGELHQLGGNLVADALESDGWDVRFLGANVPAPDVLRAVSEHRPEVVGISCTMLQNVPRVALLVGAVRGLFDPRPPAIIVGGGAFRAAPEKARHVGADGWARDLRDAVTLARELSARERKEGHP